MESKARILGHSMHPMLIVFPLGLLSTSVVFDLLYLALGNTSFPTVAYWMIVGGLIGGLVAATTGWIDWTGIPAGTRAKSVGLLHGVVNGVVMLLFAGSLYLRHTAAEGLGTVALVLSLLAFCLALLGGWLGGELVERLGIAVHTGAHPNAPNSLTASTATSTKSSPGTI